MTAPPGAVNPWDHGRGTPPGGPGSASPPQHTCDVGPSGPPAAPLPLVTSRGRAGQRCTISMEVCVPVRVSAGSHRVRVRHRGFAPPGRRLSAVSAKARCHGRSCERPIMFVTRDPDLGRISCSSFGLRQGCGLSLRLITRRRRRHRTRCSPGRSARRRCRRRTHAAHRCRGRQARRRGRSLAPSDVGPTTAPRVWSAGVDTGFRWGRPGDGGVG